jgi:uncharacterized protein YndB with AHSA1/START domain
MRAFFLALLLAPAAHAEVTSVSPTSFVSSFRQEVKAAPAQAFEAIAKLPQWWNPQHSYSGKSANLRFAMKAGDCFCEDWDGGSSIEHARVLLVMRDKHLVRLDGALGPLQELGVNGILTLSAGTADGKNFVRMVYRVTGPADAGLEKLAPVVDRVMGEQFARWSRFMDQ